MRLTRWQRLVLALWGKVRLRHEKRPGWVRPAPIYAARCERHGLYEDYPHGWKNEIECPLCWLERARKKRLRFEETVAELEAVGGG